MTEQGYETREGFKVRLTARLKNADLAGAREILGLTAKALAEQLGIYYPMYLQYENMKDYPSEERQKQICDFFRQRGVFLFEEDVFPEELRHVRTKKAYVAETRIPPEKLLPLSEVEERLLPVVRNEVESLVGFNELKESLERVLNTLTYREREVLRMRFGLDGGYTYTLKELSKIFNVTQENIRQVEARAIRKLQHPARSERLVDFVSI